MWTTGLAVLVDTVGQAHIGEFMGYVGIALNAGTLVAPLLGGVIFAKSGYNAVFGLIIAVVGVDILLRLFMKEQKASRLASVTAQTIVDDLKSKKYPDLRAAAAASQLKIKEAKNISRMSGGEGAFPRSLSEISKQETFAYLSLNTNILLNIYSYQRNHNLNPCHLSFPLPKTQSLLKPPSTTFQDE